MPTTASGQKRKESLLSRFSSSLFFSLWSVRRRRLNLHSPPPNEIGSEAANQRRRHWKKNRIRREIQIDSSSSRINSVAFLTSIFLPVFLVPFSPFFFLFFSLPLLLGNNGANQLTPSFFLTFFIEMLIVSPWRCTETDTSSLFSSLDRRNEPGPVPLLGPVPGGPVPQEVHPFDGSGRRPRHGLVAPLRILCKIFPSDFSQVKDSSSRMCFRAMSISSFPLYAKNFHMWRRWPAITSHKQKEKNTFPMGSSSSWTGRTPCRSSCVKAARERMKKWEEKMPSSPPLLISTWLGTITHEEKERERKKTVPRKNREMFMSLSCVFGWFFLMTKHQQPTKKLEPKEASCHQEIVYLDVIDHDLKTKHLFSIFSP